MQSSHKMIIAYDGTHYGGWQIQPNIPSIQETIQNALFTILQEKVTVVGAGRTDAGVHALGQVAHFHHKKEIIEEKLLSSLNSLLPSDIKVLEITPAPLTFHARFSAITKIYHYHFHLAPIHDPFTRLYNTLIPYPIDIPLLRQAAELFVGTHDFTSFANSRGKGATPPNPIKTLYSLRCIQKGHQLRLEFEGDGFLYKMVRNITATILSIAAHKMPLSAIQQLFDQKDRRLAPPPAPPEGLFLASVHYPIF
jgi:tRNA pseudouridine38-40 synthase